MGRMQEHRYSDATSEETCKQQISFSELVHPQWHSRLAKSDFKRIAATTKTTVRLQGRGPVYIEGRSTAITKAVGLLKSRVESWGDPSDIKSGKMLLWLQLRWRCPEGHRPDICFFACCQHLTLGVRPSYTPGSHSSTATLQAAMLCSSWKQPTSCTCQVQSPWM